MRRELRSVVLATIGFLAAAGCTRKSAPGGGTPAPPAPVIAVVKPQMKSVERVVEQPGTVEAFEETELLANITGYVEMIEADPEKKDRAEYDRSIDIGSRVKSGQVLARLSLPELEEEFKEKIALVKQAEAEVTQAEKAHAAAGAAVTAAAAMETEAEAAVERAQAVYDRWQLEVARVEKLIKDGVDVGQTLSETQLQFRAAGAARKEATARVASTTATIKKAEADRDKAAADVAASRARLDVARSETRRVDALRDYTRIKAPFNGIVTRRAVSRGDFVKAGDKHPLFRVARTDPVRVVVYVPEAEAGLVAEGQEVHLTLQGKAERGGVGTVSRASWSLEAASRTLRTEIDMPNEKEQFRPGMYAYARLTIQLPAAWAVPAPAVGKVNEEPVIYLVENGKAVRAAVQLLRGDGQFTQIRRYKKPDTRDWVDVTGTELIAIPAIAVVHGQPIASAP
jgi:multidrug efflux pump subunit AcrA (membrane-fusion protein)